MSGRRSYRTPPLVVAIIVATALPSAAQTVSTSERDALVKLRTDRGGQAAEVDALIQLASEAATKGVPAAPLTNKIREGLAKGADPERIDVVVRQMATHLEAADRLLREIGPMPAGSGREAAIVLLAEAIGGGVTEQEVRELGRVSPQVTTPPSAMSAAGGLSSAAKGLSLIKEARLPAPESREVITAAVRQGYRPTELVDLGREVKRREVDYRSGRASLRALRDAIVRGDRPEQLFRDSRPGTVERPAAAERPAATRPERPVERPTRPEPPQRPEPVRPGR